MNARARSFWREEIALAALLLAFFAGIVCFALPLPFDARLFPLVIGGAGILLTLAIAAVELRRPLAGIRPAVLAVRLRGRFAGRHAGDADPDRLSASPPDRNRGGRHGRGPER